jgi:hypothetical protein
MNANNITAICAIVIAIASLVISIIEVRATRHHNRQSVRPILRITRVRGHNDSRTGLKLINVGCGPAIIRGTTASFDDRIIGPWSHESFNQIVSDKKDARLGYSIYYAGDVIAAGSAVYLLFINPYKKKRDQGFWDLIAYRMGIEIEYESLYGEVFRVMKGPRHHQDHGGPRLDA